MTWQREKITKLQNRREKSTKKREILVVKERRRFVSYRIESHHTYDNAINVRAKETTEGSVQTFSERMHASPKILAALPTTKTSKQAVILVVPWTPGPYSRACNARQIAPKHAKGPNTTLTAVNNACLRWNLTLLGQQSWLEFDLFGTAVLAEIWHFGTAVSAGINPFKTALLAGIWLFEGSSLGWNSSILGQQSRLEF